ncbi:MAG: hypothetical protein HZY74_02060 [Brevundimonas sp.]|nr:MAG: hypothetical protein HZY74_02060 [Brevundimonas sp.]
MVPPLPTPWHMAVLVGLLFLWLILAVWTRLTTSHVGKLPLTGNNVGFGFFCLGTAGHTSPLVADVGRPH